MTRDQEAIARELIESATPLCPDWTKVERDRWTIANLRYKLRTAQVLMIVFFAGFAAMSVLCARLLGWW